MGWESITDASIAAYKPITARLMRKLRDRYVAAAELHTVAPFDWEGSGSEDLFYDGVCGIDLYIPDRAIGAGGVILGVYVTTSYTVGSGSPPVGRFYLNAASSTGPQYVTTPSSPYEGMAYCTLPDTTTPGRKGVLFTAQVTDSSDTITITPGRIELVRVE